MSGFRLNAKRFFLTFPQCDTPKETAANNLRERYHDLLDAFAIVAERHAATEADPVGGPHLHMLVIFKVEQNLRDPTCFDFICGKHGNYQTQRGGLKAAAIYLTKEDKEPLCFGIDLEALKAGKASLFGLLAERVKEGKSLDEIDDEFPGAVLAHKRKLEDYIDFQDKKRAKVFTAVKGTLCLNDDDVIEIGYPRAFRSLQWYIFGPHGIGKTSIINRLHEAGFRGYHMPYNGHWDDWSDDSYDFAYADEFHSQIKITELNNFLDGSPMSLCCRFRNRKKNKNVPVFILSNHPLAEQYRNVPEAGRLALASRLNVIHLMDHPTVILTLQETPTATPQMTTIP